MIAPIAKGPVSCVGFLCLVMLTGCSYLQEVTNVGVSRISIRTADGQNSITLPGGTLQLIADVTPDKATNKSVSWSVLNGSGTATISDKGLVTALTNGAVTAIATAQDGSGVSGALAVTMSGQGVGSSHWPLVRLTFDDGTAKDSSGNGYNGTNHGAVLATDRHGVPAKALGFDGTSSYLELAKALPDSQELTVLVWARFTGNDVGTLFMDATQGGGNDLVFDMNSTGVGIRADKGGASLNQEAAQAATGLSLANGWHHLAWVLRPTQSLVFVDGVLTATVGQTGGNMGFHSPHPVIGRWDGGWLMRYFQGSLDEVTIYCQALSATEVADQYNSEKPATLPTNLITNPGFEAGFTGYSLSSAGNADTATFAVDSGVRHTGTQSLKITNANPRGAQVYKGFTTTLSGLDAGKTYRVSFWVKSQSSMASTFGCIFNGAPEQAWDQRLWTNAGTYDWTQFSRTYVPGATMTLRFNTDDVGVLWLDDLVVVESAPVSVTGVTVTPASLALTAGGDTAGLTAVVGPSDATNRAVVWSSSQSSVATVDADGLVTPVAAGNATITATSADGSFAGVSVVTVTSPPLYSGMIARYTFDDGTAKDSSGTSPAGTNHGATPVADRHGVAGKALGFDGVSAYWTSNLNATPSRYTISLWRNSTGNGAGTNTRILAIGANGQDWGTVWEHSSNAQTDLNFVVTGTTTSLFPDVGYRVQPLAAHTWNQIVQSYDGTTVKVYLDGVLVGSRSWNYYGQPVKFTDLTLGGDPRLSRYFNGSLDEWGLWPRALSDSEVASLYAAEKPTVTVGSGGVVLVGLYRPSFVFSGVPVTSVTPGQAVTVSAVVTPVPDSYQWYLDGAVVSGAVGSSVTLGSNLAAGSHSMTLLVTKGSVLASESFAYTVAIP